MRHEYECECIIPGCKKIFISKSLRNEVCLECRKKRKACYNAEWHKNNPENNPERARETSAKRMSKRYYNYKDIVFNHYGKGCNCCGEDNMDKLQIDHVYNDGCRHVDKKGRRVNGNTLYKEIIDSGFSPNYQILCASCNFVKKNKGRCDCQDRFLLLKLCQAVG